MGIYLKNLYEMCFKCVCILAFGSSLWGKYILETSHYPPTLFFLLQQLDSLLIMAITQTVTSRRMQHFCSAFDPYLHGTGSCCLLHMSSGFHLSDLFKMNTDFVKWLPLNEVGLCCGYRRHMPCYVSYYLIINWPAACYKKHWQLRFGWAWYENINR